MIRTIIAYFAAGFSPPPPTTESLVAEASGLITRLKAAADSHMVVASVTSAESNRLIAESNAHYDEAERGYRIANRISDILL